MKKIISVVFLLFLITHVKGQNSTKEIVDTFFEKYQKDQVQSIDYAFSTNKYLNTNSEAIIDLKK